MSLDDLLPMPPVYTGCGVGTSTGPYGPRSSVSVRYSSSGYYGRRNYGRWWPDLESIFSPTR